MPAQYFSEYFNVTKTAGDDWFDPILGADTRLFVDPFLVFRDTSQGWADAHRELIAYFNLVFHMVGNTIVATTSPERAKALKLLKFPEPRAFCLGYTDQGTDGAGGGKGYAKLICEAMELAIGRGLKDLAHFESLGVLNEGIGPDRISDLVCNVLIERFIRYTQTVAQRHNLPTDPHRIDRGAFDAVGLRWDPVEVQLPTNPENGLPVLLTPLRFLRALHSLDAPDFWASAEAAELRADLNFFVSTKVTKKEIVALARQDPAAVDRWTRSRENSDPLPYDFEADPVGVYNWLRRAREYTAAVPLHLATPSSQPEFLDVIDQLVQDFKHFVEQRGGWQLLFNDNGDEKDETAAQLLFRGLAEARCIAHNIVIDREVELGRGVVDFKFSSGYSRRALLEVKKLHNGKFWNGLEKQLMSYLTQDQCDAGRYVAIQYRPHHPKSDVGRRQRELPRRTLALAQQLKLDLRSTYVDARRPLSASKL